jgi:tetratricopeptide (TPR) repeat protein
MKRICLVALLTFVLIVTIRISAQAGEQHDAAEGYGLPDSGAEAAFANEAKRYREMRVKPALPEDVQRYRVMAEDAFNNKDFEKALDYYRKGLAIEPLWPQGQYNAAMLAGELRRYDWAALYMKHYLELVPDAKNAKALWMEMYHWEGKG